MTQFIATTATNLLTNITSYILHCFLHDDTNLQQTSFV